jgi:hypothetical protein
MIIFTRHAKNRARRDKIDQADIESCIDNPDFERQQNEGRREVWKSYRAADISKLSIERNGEKASSPLSS